MLLAEDKASIPDEFPDHARIIVTGQSDLWIQSAPNQNTYETLVLDLW